MGWSRRRVRSSFPATAHCSLAVEILEARTVPYATIGAWPHAQLVTLSFMPDGTALGDGISSNLFASFNARWPTVVWEGQMLLAAQTWAEATNLNFAVVPDNGVPFGSGAYEQGDPGHGDIRIGGFDFGNGDLGGAWFPPPVNDFSAAGNVFFNTAQPFNIGSTYDLYTVALHEIGHALGMLGSSDYYAAMYETYVGAKSGLSPDDIAGIRSIYSANAPRSPDGFGFYTSSFQTAADLTGGFDPVSQTLVGPNLDITYPGQAEYYRFLAPAGTSAQLTVTIQSTGLSLLSPAVILYNAGQQPIADAASGYGQFGATISVSVGGAVPGQLFWLRVSGVDLSPFGTGRYALIVNFGSGASPTVPPTTTVTPNGSPLIATGGDPEASGIADADGHGFDTFQVKPDGDVTARTSSVSQSLRGGSGSASPSLGIGLEAIRSATEQLVYSVSAAASVVVTKAVAALPPPLLEAGIPQPADSRLQSSGSGHVPSFARAEMPAAATSLTNAAAGLPDPRTAQTRMARLSWSGAKWRAACTACFGGFGPSAGQQGTRAELVSAGRADACYEPNSPAALAGLIFALAGSGRTEAADPRTTAKRGGMEVG
jgi:hypothetical protein